ncbi:MAG: hypothetical protein PWQ67_1420 [Clostridia bacterium]|nr:hypothetical protein [Clostridia bacterium]MDN5322966.1 hypothetical protein [Clostridia bacterium]
MLNFPMENWQNISLLPTLLEKNQKNELISDSFTENLINIIKVRGG